MSNEFDDPSLYLTGIPTSITGLRYRTWIGNSMFSSDCEPFLVFTDNTVRVGSIPIRFGSVKLNSENSEFTVEEWEKMIQFVSINREVLLNFYQHSTDEDFSDTKDFYDKLKKVS